jgi:hypothetical protein
MPQRLRAGRLEEVYGFNSNKKWWMQGKDKESAWAKRNQVLHFAGDVEVPGRGLSTPCMRLIRSSAGRR